MLAAVAVSLFPSLGDAVAAMVSTDEVVDPIPGNASVYEQAYQRYCEVNEVLEPLFRRHFSSPEAK